MGLFSSIFGGSVGQESVLTIPEPMNYTPMIQPEQLFTPMVQAPAVETQPSVISSMFKPKDTSVSYPSQTVIETMFKGGEGQESVLGIQPMTEPPANIFEQTFLGTKTAAEASAFEPIITKIELPSLSGLYTSLDEALGGILPAGKKFWTVQNIAIAAVIGLAALYILARRR